jgi:hypothetical protein
LQSLKCALDRLTPLPDQLVILAHDKHQPRAAQDLDAIFDGKLIEWNVVDAPYATENPLAPFWWALRELFVARPAEAFLRSAAQRPQSALLTSTANVLGGFDCPKSVVIKERIMYEEDDFDEARRHWEGVHNDETANTASCLKIRIRKNLLLAVCRRWWGQRPLSWQLSTDSIGSY